MPEDHPSEPVPSPELSSDGENAASSDGSGSAGTPAGNTQPALTVVKTNVRPTRVTDLLVDGEVDENWFVSNWKHNRFYVLNLKKVSGDLTVEHTKMQGAFQEAKRIIDEETAWGEQYAFTYGCSHTTAYPDKVELPKTFAHAVTIIVAMEAWAKARKANYNVYDFLRIIPAQYFVDHFDKDRLAALTKAYDTMPEKVKAEKFGEDAAMTFNNLCLKRLGQRIGENLLLQMVSGMTVTRYVGELLMKFVKDNFDAELHVGPVLPSGSDEAVCEKLGRKNAASALRVPKGRPPEELSPPYLA